MTIILFNNLVHKNLFLLGFNSVNRLVRRSNNVLLHLLRLGSFLLAVNSILNLLLDLGNNPLQLLHFARPDGISLYNSEQFRDDLDGVVEVLDRLVELGVVGERHPELVLDLSHLPHLVRKLVLPLLEARGDVLHGLGVVLVLDADLSEREKGVAQARDGVCLGAGGHTGVDVLGKLQHLPSTLKVGRIFILRRFTRWNLTVLHYVILGVFLFNLVLIVVIVLGVSVD